MDVAGRKRAILIGLLGPAISALGFAWVLLGSATDGSPDPATFRYFLFSAPHLVIGIGVAVSFVCIPLALDVGEASQEDLEIPVFEAVEDDEEEGALLQDPPGAYTWLPK